MGIIRNLLNIMFPEKKPKIVKKVAVPTPKPQTFKSLFVIGEEFVAYHCDVDVKSFSKWLKEEHEQWYKENERGLSFLATLSFDELLEALYAEQDSAINSLLMQYVFKWYVQEHGAFRFTQSDRSFLNLTNSHILQVLYGVSDNEVIDVDSNSDIETLLPNAEDYKNNWIVGAGNSEVSGKIIQCLCAHINREVTHFKLITDHQDGYAGIEAALQSANITNVMRLAFKDITTIPNDAVTKKRFKRWDRFNTFADHANEYFRGELSKDDRSKRFDASYLLSVVSNREHVKNDHTYVSVFWGSRPIVVVHHGNGFTSAVEQGAQMVFYRMEDGFVSVTLYPAKTDHRKPIEDAIVLERHLDPQNLLKSQKRHELWEYFVAYMEGTSLDGNPSLCQKFVVWKLRHCRYYIQENEFMPAKLIENAKYFVEFLFTVGCSGIIVFFLQIGYNALYPDTSVRDSADKIIHHIDSTQCNVIKAVEQKPTIEPSDTLNVRRVDMGKKQKK